MRHNGRAALRALYLHSTGVVQRLLFVSRGGVKRTRSHCNADLSQPFWVLVQPLKCATIPSEGFARGCHLLPSFRAKARSRSESRPSREVPLPAADIPAVVGILAAG